MLPFIKFDDEILLIFTKLDEILFLLSCEFLLINLIAVMFSFTFPKLDEILSALSLFSSK